MNVTLKTRESWEEFLSNLSKNIFISNMANISGAARLFTLRLCITKQLVMMEELGINEVY